MFRKLFRKVHCNYVDRSFAPEYAAPEFKSNKRNMKTLNHVQSKIKQPGGKESRGKV